MGVKKLGNLRHVLFLGQVESIRGGVDPEHGLEVLDGILHVHVLGQLRLVLQLLGRQLQSNEDVGTLKVVFRYICCNLLYYYLRTVCQVKLG